MTPKDALGVLGLPSSASRAEIQAAFEQLALQSDAGQIPYEQRRAILDAYDRLMEGDEEVDYDPVLAPPIAGPPIRLLVAAGIAVILAPVLLIAAIAYLRGSAAPAGLPLEAGVAGGAPPAFSPSPTAVTTIQPNRSLAPPDNRGDAGPAQPASASPGLTNEARLAEAIAAGVRGGPPQARAAPNQTPAAEAVRRPIQPGGPSSIPNPSAVSSTSPPLPARPAASPVAGPDAVVTATAVATPAPNRLAPPTSAIRVGRTSPPAGPAPRAICSDGAVVYSAEPATLCASHSGVGVFIVPP